MFGSIKKGRLYSTAVFLLMLPIAAILTEDVANGSDILPMMASARTINIEDYNRSTDFIFDQTGTASWYGKRFHNRKTANGERYNMNALTAAHRKLPFGTIVRVTNIDTDKSVLLRINDRGPYVHRRVMDLSYRSAFEIDGVGLPKVKIEGLKFDPDNLAEADTNTYYFGYSYHKPLVCLPEHVIELTDSATTFSDVVKKYNHLMAGNSSTSTDFYLMVKAGEKRRRDRGYSYKYFIGRPALVEPDIDIAAKGPSTSKQLQYD